MKATPSGGLQAVLAQRRADLRRFLVARTGSEAEADDILSELWIKAATANVGPIANHDSYLFIMADHLVLDRVREARRRERRERDWTAERHGRDALQQEAADPEPGADDRLIREDEARRLRAAIERIPPGARRVLRLHKLEGLSHGEVAARLGISRSAVEKHMAVAMAHLRRLVGD